MPAVLTEATLLGACRRPHVWQRGPNRQGDPEPTFLVSGWTAALHKAGGYFTEISHGRYTACTSSTEQNQRAESPSQLMLSHLPHTGQCHQQLGDWKAQMSFVSKRGDKISSCVLYTRLQWILRISYSHQRCIFHPGSRSRHINPTAHNTFTVFKMCRWSMCRRRFYEQEMLEQPIVVRGQHGSCQQRL